MANRGTPRGVAVALLCPWLNPLDHSRRRLLLFRLGGHDVVLVRRLGVVHEVSVLDGQPPVLGHFRELVAAVVVCPW